MQKLCIILITVLCITGCSSSLLSTSIGKSMGTPSAQAEGAGNNTNYGSAAGAANSNTVNADSWAASIASLSQMEQGRIAEQVYNNVAGAETQRERALYIIASRPVTQSLAAQQILSRLYVSADQQTKARMERTMLNDMRTATPETVRYLASSIPRVQENVFPWIVIVWEAANKGLLTDNASAIARIGNPSYFANPALFGLQGGVNLGSTPFDIFQNTLGESPYNSMGNPNPIFKSTCVSLALPMSGAFASVGRQVAQGAAVAQETLAQQGVNIALSVFDTEDPSWLDRLNAQPPACILVGGPLRAESFTKVAQAGFLNSRAFFTFMPQLPQGYTEGQGVWRFFTSPQDQIDAVLDFAIGSLGIASFGDLYPDESYGKRMSELFLASARQRNAQVQTMMYPLNEMKTWSKSLATFVGSVAVQKGKLPRTTVSFKSIFLPDSWKNMEMLASTLHYHGATGMVLLGTTLWEQTLSTASSLNTDYFKLALFPGVWNETSHSTGAFSLKQGMTSRHLKADDWSALGYDFIQFAAALDFNNSSWNPQVLNTKLASQQAIAWAGAPFSWNSNGLSKRHLFLFQPSSTGMTLLDKTAFINLFQAQQSL